ncbi:Retrovirus-related Pol polyprotein from transposon RE1 [Vitis vinifera]|uniref:Retrovirus-related Pol polyprotein from transposon RE1 n=1 Tax=Vitis vinifera TaxID=29760 RepID=A0A438JV93_VITVI|nr:Retrovirus-related Pol polyprotein from transposon RE1 [Vitis vinifera]
MSPSSNTSSVIPVFNGEHYHIWAVKMRFYLRSQGLWNVVMSEADPPPLGANPTVAQMKAYEEEKLKKDKAITCLHSGLADHIFTKIMNLETPKLVWDKLQGEFEGSERVKTVRLLTLKREFELMKMKDDESVKDYSGRLMDVVNQMRLLELTSKLHAQEQRVLMRGDEATEGAFQANHKGKNSGNLQGKKFFKNNKGKAEGSSRKGKFRLALIVEEPTMLRKIVGTKWLHSHMTKYLSIFTSIDRSVQPKVKLGNGEVVQERKRDNCYQHQESAKIDESVVWHKRYGHFNLKSLRFMQEAGMVEDMPEISVNAQTCESCELGKQQRQPFPQNMSKRATHKLELIHSDICGPMSTASLSNNVFKKMVETQSGQNVKVLRTDNGEEEQNVMEMARCMLFEKKLPKLLWAEAVNTSVYLLNRLPTKSVQSKTPIEAWSGVKPSVKHLKVFGSFCYLHVPSVKRGKLDERAEKGVFVGYAAESKGYRIYSLSRMKIVISRDVHFDENSYWNWDLKKVHKCDQTTPSILEPAIESTIIEGPLDVEATSDTPEAARFLEWIEAMKAEIDAIERNGTWKLTELPEAKNAIGVKWVFRTKFNSDGSIFRHKARLVVKGFAQVAGVDYGDTFAPVARHDTIRLLLALAVKWDGKLSLYVDDMLVTGSNVKLLADFKMEMQDVFEMSDLGIMNYFLGMEIYQCSWGIFISQRKYAMDILKKFKLESCKEVATPLAQNEKISKNDGEKLEEPSAYRSLVGSLLYLTVTRPDLMFPASLLSRFMRGVKLDGYADSDWAGSVDDMKSTSGYVFTIGSGVICWNSRKQEVVAQSTTEAEYISLAAAANQAIWLRKLLADLGQEQSSPTELYCDNKSAISITQNPVQHGRTKHINVKFHSIREAEKNSLVKLHYCSTDEQLADIMTKGLPKSRLEFLRLKLGMSKANLKEEC